MSVLQKAFDRKDVALIVIYIETCDGVPDHAAELKRQVKKHKMDYPVLDGEAGKLNDPAFARLGGAPHAVLVDGRGRILRTYRAFHQPERARADLEELLATGRLPDHPHDPWREFKRLSWVERRIEGRTAPRTERVTLAWVMGRSVSIDRGKKRETLGRRFARKNVERVERDAETLVVDGRKVKARVFDSAWKRGAVAMRSRSWIADGVLLKRETRETCPDRAAGHAHAASAAAGATRSPSGTRSSRAASSRRWSSGRAGARSRAPGSRRKCPAIS